METTELWEKTSGKHSCVSRRRRKPTEAEKKSETNKFDLAGPDRWKQLGVP